MDGQPREPRVVVVTPIKADSDMVPEVTQIKNREQFRRLLNGPTVKITFYQGDTPKVHRDTFSAAQLDSWFPAIRKAIEESAYKWYEVDEVHFKGFTSLPGFGAVLKYMVMSTNKGYLAKYFINDDPWFTYSSIASASQELGAKFIYADVTDSLDKMKYTSGVSKGFAVSISDVQKMYKESVYDKEHEVRQMFSNSIASAYLDGKLGKRREEDITRFMNDYPEFAQEILDKEEFQRRERQAIQNVGRTKDAGLPKSAST